jgi:hypothetical protein
VLVAIGVAASTFVVSDAYLGREISAWRASRSMPLVGIYRHLDPHAAGRGLRAAPVHRTGPDSAGGLSAEPRRRGHRGASQAAMRCGVPGAQPKFKAKLFLTMLVAFCCS